MLGSRDRRVGLEVSEREFDGVKEDEGTASSVVPGGTGAVDVGVAVPEMLLLLLSAFVFVLVLLADSDGGFFFRRSRRPIVIQCCAVQPKPVSYRR